jgi:hypothetical protein
LGWQTYYFAGGLVLESETLRYGALPTAAQPRGAPVKEGNMSTDYGPPPAALKAQRLTVVTSAESGLPPRLVLICSAVSALHAVTQFLTPLTKPSLAFPLTKLIKSIAPEHPLTPLTQLGAFAANSLPRERKS